MYPFMATISVRIMHLLSNFISEKTKYATYALYLFLSKPIQLIPNDVLVTKKKPIK